MPSKTPHSALFSPTATPKILSTVRCLAADLVQQFNGGHPGTAMGAAAIGLALWGHAMEFNPKDPGWIARDRFVLSAGHACLLQYMYLHFTGYEAWPLEMLKRYHSPDFKGSLAAGHPEVEFEGIEVTTGPLGQGIANAVGLAIAGKHLGAKYDRDGFKAVGDRVWCFSGDGCLQEGVGMEAISLAGHLQLDNLVLIYDDNAITVDGNIDLTFSDDTSAKLAAQGWEVHQILQGGTDDAAMLCNVFDQARNSTSGKPVFIRIKTVIGFGSQNAGLAPTHGAALGPEDVRGVKIAHGQHPDEHFVIPQEVYTAFAQRQQQLQQRYHHWQEGLKVYATKYPELYKEYQAQFSPQATAAIGQRAAELLPPKNKLPTQPTPTRKASGIAVHTLAPAMPQIIAGSADLMDSTFVSWPGHVEFQAPKSSPAEQARSAGRDAGWHGRQVRYGIREHAMAAIANGLSAYSSSSSAMIPVISTFFMFFLYAAPAIRMAALQRLRLIGIATHDSIGIGEDGPTHQPVELAALFRAMPGLNFLRPADAEEVMGAWQLAMSDELHRTPSIFSLSRQGVPLLDGTDRNKVSLGGYIVHRTSPTTGAPQLVFVATGSEVARAIGAADVLAKEGLSVNVVSMPSQRLFDKQPLTYREQVLPLDKVPVVAVEAYTSFGWAKYAHASISMHSFGLSGPQEGLYTHFGFDPADVAGKVKQWAGPFVKQATVPPRGQFGELSLGTAEEHHHYF